MSSVNVAGLIHEALPKLTKLVLGAATGALITSRLGSVAEARLPVTVSVVPKIGSFDRMLYPDPDGSRGIV